MIGEKRDDRPSLVADDQSKYSLHHNRFVKHIFFYSLKICFNYLGFIRVVGDGNERRYSHIMELSFYYIVFSP
jgi:hypothetical protein